MALVAGDGWLEKGDNLLVFGPPDGGKSHSAAAIGLGLIENGWRVLFTRTTDPVQRLQVARRERALESAIAKLDKYHLPDRLDPSRVNAPARCARDMIRIGGRGRHTPATIRPLRGPDCPFSAMLPTSGLDTHRPNLLLH